MSLLSLNCEDTKINSDDLETLSFRLLDAAHSSTCCNSFGIRCVLTDGTIKYVSVSSAYFSRILVGQLIHR